MDGKERLCALIHYRCGPLSRLWCMRYEAKHSYFKQLARVIGNFKNMPKSLANRHQHYMCYLMMEPSTYMKAQISYTGGKLSQNNNYKILCNVIVYTCS